MTKLEAYQEAKEHLARVRHVAKGGFRFSRGDEPDELQIRCYSKDYERHGPGCDGSGGSWNLGPTLPTFVEALNARAVIQAMKDEALRLATLEMEKALTAAEGEAKEVLAKVAAIR